MGQRLFAFHALCFFSFESDHVIPGFGWGSVGSIPLRVSIVPSVWVTSSMTWVTRLPGFWLGSPGVGVGPRVWHGGHYVLVLSLVFCLARVLYKTLLFPSCTWCGR